MQVCTKKNQQKHPYLMLVTIFAVQRAKMEERVQVHATPSYVGDNARSLEGGGEDIEAYTNKNTPS